MNNKKMMIFLGGNFAIALFLAMHLYYKNTTNEIINSQKAVNQQMMSQQINQIVKPTQVVNNEPQNKVVTPPVQKVTEVKGLTALATNSNPQVIKEEKICALFGPLNIQQKTSFDILVKKYNAFTGLHLEQKPLYEIYWDLGIDKVNANTLFAKQKSGPLKDDKFQLTQEEGRWIVSIAYMTNAASAQKMADKLTQSAGQVNAGGVWQFKQKPDAYFYRIEDLNVVNSEFIKTIEKTVVVKQMCDD